MARRPTREELQLRLTAFQNLAQSADADCDPATLAALKQLIEIHRLALEILRAMERNDANGAENPNGQK